MPVLLLMLSLPLLADSYQYKDSTGTIHVVDSQDEVPPRYRRSMKRVSEDSHSAISVSSEAKGADDVDVRNVIDDALKKQKADPSKRIITFEALARKEGEAAPTVAELKALAEAEATAAAPQEATSDRGSDQSSTGTSPPWVGFIPLLVGLGLAWVGISKLQGFMRMVSVMLGIVLGILGYVRAFPESPVAQRVSAEVDSVAEKTGTKGAFEKAQETISKPFKAPLEAVGKAKDAIKGAEDAQKAKIQALDKLTQDD